MARRVDIVELQRTNRRATPRRSRRPNCSPLRQSRHSTSDRARSTRSSPPKRSVAKEPQAARQRVRHHRERAHRLRRPRRRAKPPTGDDIDLDEWLSGDNTIYVVATAHEQARLRPVLTVLIQQAIRTAYDTATANEAAPSPTHASSCSTKPATSHPCDDLPGYASTARSHGISLVSIWQDLAQIKSIYGDRAQTVLNNHRAKLFGTGIADDATLDYLSRLIGDERRTELNQSGDLHSGRRSISEHVTYRRTAPADAIRRVRSRPRPPRLRQRTPRPTPTQALVREVEIGISGAPGANSRRRSRRWVCFSLAQLDSPNRRCHRVARPRRRANAP